MENNNIRKRKDMTIILIYVMLSVSGLLLLKIGTTKAFNLSIANGNVNISFNVILLIGTCFYVMSFVTSLIAMRAIDLSIFYPISAGLGYILVCLLSHFVLKENISRRQLIGILFILVGVIFMNLRKE